MQDTLIAAMQNIYRFEGRSSLATWLTGTLKHKIVDSIRSAGRATWQEFREEDIAAGVGPVLGDPEGDMHRSDFFAFLERCLKSLPPKTRRVFVLRELMGLDVAETCSELAISPDYCAVMLHRARARLRAGLSVEGYGAQGMA